MKKVIICDDHAIVREGLKKLISTFGNYEVILDLESGESLISHLKDSNPDVIILDVSLPGRSGLEILKSIIAMNEQANVLILSMYPEDQYAIRMIKAGAKGYLHKDCEPKILKEALDEISKGSEYVSASLTKVLFKQMNKKDDRLPHTKLSDREYEVFLALGDGCSLSEIGVRLNLSVKTISTYRSRIMEKMDAESNSDLVKYIIAHNLNVSPLISG